MAFLVCGGFGVEVPY
nr:hypothetical protein [Vibrio parahaemolyticus]